MLNAIERLVLAGIDRESAGEAVIWYLSQGTEENLEEYIQDIEKRSIHA